MLKIKNHLKHLLLLFFLVSSSSVHAGPELVMATQGYILIAPHVHGFDRTASTNAGYRVDLTALTDLIRWNQMYFSFLTTNKTLISNSPEVGGFGLDMLIYTLSPDFRYEFNNWMLRVAYLHESLHSVSRATLGRTVWMNSLQLSVGSKGSNYLYIWEEYKKNRDKFLNHLDGRAYVGIFRRGDGTIWTSRNHDYKMKLGGRVRFQIGSFNKWAYFVGSDLTGWLRESGDWEGKGLVRFNVFRKGLKNFAGVYYAYNFYDTFRPDNEQYLGSLGLQVIF